MKRTRQFNADNIADYMRKEVMRVVGYPICLNRQFINLLCMFWLRLVAKQRAEKEAAKVYDYWIFDNKTTKRKNERRRAYFKFVNAL